ncbi:GntR family transcriptional regulator [Burkholderia multivorans]|uniref:GntR family transcriptional regulator n=1 Tax=Burkholderia multivorans TaxID=87883 RepID=UPI000CFF88D8|nr:GntR family transcriptional regulator [Burkholderia multivorans]PRG89231.1 GntR family transcriptional regulator [Burkholderia multivorans]
METGWSELAPDPLSDTPLYLQLARKLAGAIHGGTWRAGEALPSERALSASVGVSRITARRALALLVEQGLIRRSRGAGSFITPRVADPLSRLVGFTAKMRQRGFMPDPLALGASLYEYLEARGMNVVRALQHFRAVNATREIAKWMAVKPGAALLVITRIGYGADQRAIEVTETYCRDDYYDFVAELKR